MIPVLGSQPAGDVSHKPGVGCHYFPPDLQLADCQEPGSAPEPHARNVYVFMHDTDRMIRCI